jgi:N-6 DNA Methylase
MTTTKNALRYNERAWAIDVIGTINAYCQLNHQAIVRAGGEYGVAGQGSVMFPDVLLFGEDSGTVVLQGWELKMPDTAITDSEFIRNAQIKAERLKLTSFVLCNVNEAVLYVHGADQAFHPHKQWCNMQALSRSTVQQSRAAWTDLIHRMLADINQFFNEGLITPSKPEWVIGDRLWVDFLEQHVPNAAMHLKQLAQRRARLRAELDLWWRENKVEHAAYTLEQAFVRISLVSWINRFLFAHCLKHTHRAARQVEQIVDDMSLEQGAAVFEQISQSTDFITILKADDLQLHIDESSWRDLKDLNAFLTQIKLETIPQHSLHAIIDNALGYARKKLAGQFSTPRALALLLAHISIDDLTQPVMDTCCGTGTIPRAVYDLKRSAGLSAKQALSTVWGSDKFAFPLQLSALAMADPLAMGEVVQVFPHDAFSLQTNQSVSFTHPQTGVKEHRKLPVFHSIVSNLPFVRFEDSQALNPALPVFMHDENKSDDALGGLRKADLYAFLTLKLWHLLAPGGRLGLIMSNAWLGANWGIAFRRLVLERFQILKVVISGQGRWFDNADVVTTLLVLEKRRAHLQTDESETIDFVCTQQKIENWDNNSDGIAALAQHILVQSPNQLTFTNSQHDFKQLILLESMGIGWSAYFTPLDWVQVLAHCLIPANTLFEIKRGARRGWDALFYPEVGHGIESQFIKPVLMSSKGITGLMADPQDEAFCCNHSVAQLKASRQTGTLKWIARFKHQVNEKNCLLSEVLSRGNALWYEMSPSELADFVVSMNPDKRLAVHRLANRAFVNQRLIRLSHRNKKTLNAALHHALLNSVVGMFLIEASGFGRGLGALDLNATKLSAQLHMLNPALLSNAASQTILTAFAPLLKRSVMDLDSELCQEDRIHFDDTVLNAYGLLDNSPLLRGQIYRSLLANFHIRQTART